MNAGGNERIFDEIFHALSDIHRRRVLRSLLVHNLQDHSSISVNSEVLTDSERSTAIHMRHIHLPMLVQYGFITWDQDTNKISRGPQFEEIRPVLELFAAHEGELPYSWV